MNAGEAKSALKLAYTNPDPPVTAKATKSGPTGTVPHPDAPTAAPAGPDQGTLNGVRWSRYAGKLAAAGVVSASGAIIKKKGFKPNPPDDDDIDLLVSALDEGLALRFGAANNVPWWLGAALASGGIYANMRVGAEPLEQKPEMIQDPLPESAPPPPAPTLPEVSGVSKKTAMDEIMPQSLGSKAKTPAVANGIPDMKPKVY